MDGRFDTSRNFLATDEVPKTIFGIPVVSRKEDYTEEDLAFFREHPEAGGYYDLGDSEGGTVRGAIGGGDSVPDEVRKYYRDPLTGKENVPDSVTRGWEAFRMMNPDATGYSWNSVKGFGVAENIDPGFTRAPEVKNIDPGFMRAPEVKNIDPGFTRAPEVKNIDPGFMRAPREEPTWYAHRDYVPGTGKNKYGESVIGYP